LLWRRCGRGNGLGHDWLCRWRGGLHWWRWLYRGFWGRTEGLGRSKLYLKRSATQNTLLKAWFVFGFADWTDDHRKKAPIIERATGQ
tara:strand:- start:1454 stop:1714 length:261 start_codon:yes stop_codon:yes gene_type:complete